MINIAGQKFNYLTAVKPIGKTKKRTIIWECVCECGNKTSRHKFSQKWKQEILWMYNAQTRTHWK